MAHLFSQPRAELKIMDDDFNVIHEIISQSVSVSFITPSLRMYREMFHECGISLVTDNRAIWSRLYETFHRNNRFSLEMESRGNGLNCHLQGRIRQINATSVDEDRMGIELRCLLEQTEVTRDMPDIDYNRFICERPAESREPFARMAFRDAEPTYTSTRSDWNIGANSTPLADIQVLRDAALNNVISFGDCYGALDNTEAYERAEQLLEQYLTPSQRADYQEYGYFHVTGSSTGSRYRLTGKKPNYNVTELDWEGKEIARYCATPGAHLPMPDVLLAQKLWLENAEVEFLRAANRIPNKDPWTAPQFSSLHNDILLEFDEPTENALRCIRRLR